MTTATDVKMEMATLSAEQVRKLLSYDPETGELRWLCRCGHAMPGTLAGGTARKRGKPYRVVGINGQLYYAHRLIWLIVTSRWPDPQVDHRDGDGLNNRWINLREASNSRNHANTGKRVDNTTGAKGVCFDYENWRYMAQIRVRGEMVFLGRYSTKAEAKAAYDRAAVRFFGEFAHE